MDAAAPLLPQPLPAHPGDERVLALQELRGRRGDCVVHASRPHVTSLVEQRDTVVLAASSTVRPTPNAAVFSACRSSPDDGSASTTAMSAKAAGVSRSASRASPASSHTS